MHLTERLTWPIGRGHFTAYEGDVEWIEDERTGLVVPANPVVYASPWFENTITTLGKQFILDQLDGVTSTPVKFVGVGVDNTASAAANTKLDNGATGNVLFQAEDATFPSRAALVETHQSTFGTGVANFAWAECGLGNSLTNDGTHLFDRIAPIGPFTKSNVVSIVLVITVTQA